MNTNDLSLGFDPTNQPSITGAQLASLITTATPSSDRGMCLFTSDDPYGTPNVPNPNTTPEFARYIWIRLQGNLNAFAVYVWNPNQLNNTNPTVLLNWNPIALGIIPAGSIQNFQLAGGITYDKITSVQFSSIINNSSIVLTTTALTSGVIIGSFGNGFTINTNSITNAMLVSDANTGSPTAPVKTNNIVDGSVTLTKFDRTGSVGQFLTSQGASAPTWTTLGTVKLLQTVFQDSLQAAYIAAGSSGTNTQILNTAAPGIKFSAANPGILANVGSASNYQTGLPVGFSTSGKSLSTAMGICTAITPLSLTSTLIVDIVLNVLLSQADFITVCLYGFGAAASGALPSASLTAAGSGIAVINNTGGSASTIYTPLTSNDASGLCIQGFACTSGFNRLHCRFVLPTAQLTPSLTAASILIPFIGALTATTNIGINSSSSSAASYYYGGSNSGPFQSYMSVQEILL